MKFKINGRTWKIKELSQEEIRQHKANYKYDGKVAETIKPSFKKEKEELLDILKENK